MIKNYKMILQYDGSRYDGWQKQKNTENTIQGKLEAVLSKLEGRQIEVIGSGRTDAGVHAKGQTANFKIDDDSQDAVSLHKYINRYLPDDIAVLSLEKVPERFHSRLNAKRKTYSYWIETAGKKDVFERRYCYGLGKKLDTGKMREAAKALVGEHDFKNFSSGKKSSKSTVRRIDSISIKEHGTKVQISITADGFLYNMVRIITGTLIEAGMGKRNPSSVKNIFEGEARADAGFMAPPEGLFLDIVYYE